MAYTMFCLTSCSKLKFEKLEPVSVGHFDLEITRTTNEPWKWLLIHFSSGKLVIQLWASCEYNVNRWEISSRHSLLCHTSWQHFLHIVFKGPFSPKEKTTACRLFWFWLVRLPWRIQTSQWHFIVELLLSDSLLFGLCRVTRALSLGKEVAAECFKCHCEQRQRQGKAGNHPWATDPLWFQRLTVWQLVSIFKLPLLALIKPGVLNTC